MTLPSFALVFTCVCVVCLYTRVVYMCQPPKPKNIVPVAKSHSSAIPMGDAEKDRLISQLEGELKTLRSVQPSSSAPTPARAPTAANPPMTKTQLVSTNKGGMTSRMQTPAEKREAKSLADDIASVRGL